MLGELGASLGLICSPVRWEGAHWPTGCRGSGGTVDMRCALGIGQGYRKQGVAGSVLSLGSLICGPVNWRGGLASVSLAVTQSERDDQRQNGAVQCGVQTSLATNPGVCGDFSSGSCAEFRAAHWEVKKSSGGNGSEGVHHTLDGWQDLSAMSHGKLVHVFHPEQPFWKHREYQRCHSLPPA
jgi:hypothetical protein